MDKRTDALTAARVDLAIYTATAFGMTAGARELSAQGVPVEIAVRTLLRPASRRITAARLELFARDATT